VLLLSGFPTDQRNGDKEFVIRRAATNRVLNVLRHWVSKHSQVQRGARAVVSPWHRAAQGVWVCSLGSLSAGTGLAVGSARLQLERQFGSFSLIKQISGHGEMGVLGMQQGTMDVGKCITAVWLLGEIGRMRSGSEGCGVPWCPPSS